MDLGLRDQVYVITGGGRGLGRATAEALVAEGAKVVLSGRQQASLDEAVEALGTEHAVGVATDNADPETPQRLIEATSRWGRVDGALISVGGPVTGPVTAVDDQEWTTAFESVFLGTVRMCRALVPALSGGGSIALVLSSSVRNPLPNMAVSNGLRPGLAMVAKTLADEVGAVGIRVNGLMPGRVGTERVSELDELTGDPEAARQRAVGSIPLGRYGEPAEFGRVATFLLSPAASYVTGAMVPVDGGMQRGL